MTQRKALPKTWKPDLVPICIEIEHNGQTFREEFCWNPSEERTTPEEFARILCCDLDLPESAEAHVADSIRTHIYDFEQRKTARRPEKMFEARVVLPVVARVGDIVLNHCIEWDLSNPANSPDEYAKVFCEEHNLSGEWGAAISFCLRKKILERLAEIQDKRHPDLLGPVGRRVIRDAEDAARFEPSFYKLTEQQLAMWLEEDRTHRSEEGGVVVSTSGSRDNSKADPTKAILYYGPGDVAHPLTPLSTAAASRARCSVCSAAAHEPAWTPHSSSSATPAPLFHMARSSNKLLCAKCAVVWWTTGRPPGSTRRVRVDHSRGERLSRRPPLSPPPNPTSRPTTTTTTTATNQSSSASHPIGRPSTQPATGSLSTGAAASSTAGGVRTRSGAGEVRERERERERERDRDRDREMGKAASGDAGGGYGDRTKGFRGIVLYQMLRKEEKEKRRQEAIAAGLPDPQVEDTIRRKRERRERDQKRRTSRRSYGNGGSASDDASTETGGHGPSAGPDTHEVVEL